MRRQAGFTLIEVMVAIAILALMMGIGWGVSNQIVKAKQKYGAQQDRWRGARLAMSRMTRDFSMAYISGNEDRSREDTRTFFFGDADAQVATARFSALVHTPLYNDANESDQTIIEYLAQPDRLERRKTNLIRRETRRLSNEKPRDIPGSAEVLFHDLEKLELAYWDVKAKEWRDTWSTSGADANANKLPDRVRIKLTFLDENGKPVTLTTQARIHLQEVLSFYAN